MTASPSPTTRVSQPAPSGDFPGRTLGIVGLIVSFFASLVGLIISIVALKQSKDAGYKNTPALAGIIVGSVTLVLAVIFFATSLAALSVGSTGY